VKQFHFISWPDFGVPRHATPLLYFLGRIRKFHKYSNSRPIVLHCRWVLEQLYLSHLMIKKWSNYYE